MDDNDETTTTTEEKTVAKKARKAAAKKPAAKKRKTKAKAAKAASTNGTGKRPLDEERKDTVAAALRIRAGTPRAKLVEHLASKNGKLVTADALAKLVDWDRKTVQQFLTVRVPAKSKKYRLGYEVLSDKEGSYGLAVK